VGDRRDFFVSHAGTDRAWAEWVAWQLIDAGYTVELDAWDWAAGQNLVLAMSDALARCDRVVALFSAVYFDRNRYTTDEWTAALLHVPGTGQGRLLPVRVEEIPPAGVPPVLQPLKFCDLFDVDAAEARRVLLEAAQGPRRPGGEPVFPGKGTPGSSRKRDPGPQFPGLLPRVWNLPARNPGFIGRDELLVAVRERLLASDKAVVQAFQGMGGVGKTQLAIEYAYRFGRAYDLAWWVSSEQPGLLGDQFAALGTELGCLQPGADSEVVRAKVLGALRERGRWLLIFDNAENPADIAGWLPGGGGHVLITSRERKWAEVAAPVEVEVLDRPESVAILRARVSGLGTADAEQLADQLGDLPLAIAQAGAFMAETGMTAAQYLALLHTRAGQLLAQGVPGSYPRSLAATTLLIADRLARDDPAADELATLCAFLAPEPIPADLFTSAAKYLPEQLAARAADPLAWGQTLAHLTRRSLVRVDHGLLQMHRLTQVIIRDHLAPDQASDFRGYTEAILAASNPGDVLDPSTWPRWTVLIPQLLALDLAATDNPALRSLACGVCWYLITHGDTRTGYHLARDFRHQWLRQSGDRDKNVRLITLDLDLALRRMGNNAEARSLAEEALSLYRYILPEDHPDTLSFASSLATSLRELGDVQAAHDLDEDTLERRRRILGEDNSATLRSARHLADDLRLLGEAQAARDLDQVILARCNRVLGQDHPDTLRCAVNLANDLHTLGDVQAASDLGQDTLARCRRVLGEDHPDTLRCAADQANNLRALGEVQAARDLDQDTLTRRRRVLGEDHPDTLASASNLAADLRELEEGDDP
jgi:tetratricopeptide (TPR) repeat protein